MTTIPNHNRIETMRHFLLGYRCLLAGFALLGKPGIRLYVLVPLLVNAALFAAVIALAVWQTDALIEWMRGEWPWTGWFAWLIWAAVIVLLLALLFFTFSLVANLLAAPFNGMLAEAVTRHLISAGAEAPVAAADTLAANQEGGWKALSAAVGKAVKSEAGKIRYHLTRVLLLLLLSLALLFIPFLQAAAPVAPFLGFLLGAWLLALEYLEYPLGNRGKTFLEVRDIAAGNLLLSLGFGTGAALLTLLPVVNFIAMPVAVAAAAKLSLERLNAV